MILNVGLFFLLHIMLFRKRTRGRGLDLLRKGMAFIILNIPRKATFHLQLFSVHLIKIQSGYIICVQVTPPLGFYISCFLIFFQRLDIFEFHCDICELAKHTRVFFPMSNKRSPLPFQLIHSGIWGPSNIPNVSDACWFVSLIDDCTRVTWLFLLKQKSEVNTIIPNFHSMI